MVVESTHLKLLPARKDNFHPKIQRAVDSMIHCIIDLVVKYKGEISIKRVEEVTGMRNISSQFTADIIRYMSKEGVIEIRNERIRGSVATLTEVLEQAKTRLPKNHGKPWSEDDMVRLAELRLDKLTNSDIAIKLERTEQSIQMQCSLLRKSFRLIPIIERNKVVREFVSVTKSPNPEI